jgi:hypothetical protein
MEQSRIQAVHHVNLEAPIGAEEPFRWFYGEVVQLEEVPCEVAGSSQMCFKSKQIELRVQFVPTPDIDPLPLRVTIAVPLLSDAIERLEEKKVPFKRLTGVMFTDRRLQTHDPAGNRIELRQLSRDGPF